MPGIRLGASMGALKRMLHLDLEGALVGLTQGQTSAEMPKGSKDLTRAGISQRFGETETQTTSPRTQMGGPGGLIKAAGAGPTLRAPGPEGPTNFGAAERWR